MKRILIVFALLSLCACGPKHKAGPIIEQSIKDMISHPETYHRLSLEYLGEGIYKGNDVKVFRQKTRHIGRDGSERETTICLVLNKDLNYVYATQFTEDMNLSGFAWKR